MEQGKPFSFHDMTICNYDFIDYGDMSQAFGIRFDMEETGGYYFHIALDYEGRWGPYQVTHAAIPNLKMDCSKRCQCQKRMDENVQCEWLMEHQEELFQLFKERSGLRLRMLYLIGQ